MSKEIVKLYSHDGKIINVIEVTKKHYDKNSGFLLEHNWLTYDEAAEDLEFGQRVRKILNRGKHNDNLCELNTYAEQSEYLITKIEKKQVSLSNSIEALDKGQKMLLDRIKDNSESIEGLQYDHINFVKEVWDVRDYTAKQEERNHYTYIVLILISIALSIIALVN